MRKFIQIFKWVLLSVFTLVAILLIWFYLSYGGSGEAFPNMATKPLYPQDSLQIIATLPEPPGNVAVSKEGRIFCTYHAEGKPDIKVWELVNGQPVPFPNEQWQSSKNGDVFLDAIFNIRIDAKNRLWTLDHGQNGFKTPRLLCFDIDSRKLITQIDIPADICGKGSYIQDMQIDTLCKKIYIADLSAFGKTPALVIVDIDTKHCRRVLEKHFSVMPERKYKVVNKGREMKPAGPLFFFHPGFDPIALDRKNEYLYYGPMSGSWIYRIKISEVNNTGLSASELESKVEKYAKRGQCDGITMDNNNNIYLTDIENGSIAVIDNNKKYYTLVSHPKMRWPDGLCFGADGYVYVSDSDIPDVMMQSKSHMAKNKPYYLWKFKALSDARNGQ